VPLRWIVASLCGGVLLGVVMVVAPLVAVVAGLAFVIGRLALRGLGPAERRLLLAILAVAVCVRVGAVSALAVVNAPRHDDQIVGAMSGDEAYSFARALRTRDVLLGTAATKYEYFIAYDEYGRNSYITFLTAAQVLFGPSPYGMRLANSLLFLSGLLLLFELARRTLGRLAAFGGMILVLFLPSLFLLSVSLLKESLYLFGTAAIIVGTVAVVRGRWPGKTAGAAALAAGLAIVNGLRPGAFALAASGLALGFILRFVFASRRTLAFSLAAVLAAAAVVAARPSIERRVLDAVTQVAKTQSGHVFTVGHAYKLLDEGFYYSPAAPIASKLELTRGEALRFLARAGSSLVVTPLPWQLISARELLYLPEQLIWYAIVLLLPFGARAGWRRDPLVTALLVGYALPTLAALAVTNGNVGTLLRLREVMGVPLLAWVSALGAADVLAMASASLTPAPLLGHANGLSYDGGQA
jgi:hypothetical protein